jgi:hypothetical protein
LKQKFRNNKMLARANHEKAPSAKQF